jgi:hypothetical protein
VAFSVTSNRALRTSGPAPAEPSGRKVKNLAEIAVNGQSLGIVWRKPFSVDVTDTLKPVANAVEIRVTNL